MNDKKRIGLYFGSFNPIHEGHIFVVQKALENGIDKLFLVVLPQSPFNTLNHVILVVIRKLPKKCLST